MEATASESKRFYVGNLSSDITEAELRGLFERFGPVAGVDVKSKRDIDGHVTASFAFVKVDNLSDVDVSNVIKVLERFVNFARLTLFSTICQKNQLLLQSLFPYAYFFNFFFRQFKILLIGVLKTNLLP